MTNELIIKFVSQEDIVSDFYIEKMNDPELHKYTSHANFKYTTKDALTFWEKIEKKEIIAMGIYVMEYAHNLGAVSFSDAIYGQLQPPTKTGKLELLGICCLQEINWINRTAEIAFLIFESRKGLGYQLGITMIQHAFFNLNLNKVWLGCASQNIAMIGLAEKLDMEKEGILKNHIWINGKYMDVYRYCSFRNK